MIHPTDSLSELNNHPTDIRCGTETIHDRPEILQLLDCALYSSIQDVQIISLHLDLSRQSTR